MDDVVSHYEAYISTLAMLPTGNRPGRGLIINADLFDELKQKARQYTVRFVYRGSDNSHDS